MRSSRRSADVVGDARLFVRFRYSSMIVMLAGGLLASVGCSSPSEDDPLRIVLMQDSAAPFNVVTPARLAERMVNEAGGIGGRRIEVEFIRQEPDETAYLLQAKKVAEDPSVAAMIYTGGSASFQKMSSIFVDLKKPIVSSTSTAASIPRIYADDGFVWRTTESDISQVKALMTIVARDFGGRGPPPIRGDQRGGEPLPIAVEDFFEFELNETSIQDGSVLEVECPTDPRPKTRKCRGFEFDADKADFGQGVWRHAQPGLVLAPNAAEVSFVAWGKKGDERVSFQVGIPGFDSFSRTVELVLTKTPQAYSIPLYTADYGAIVGGFAWTIFASGNGGRSTFYVDDIRWTSKGVLPKVALLTNYDAYSDTFFDWSGFYAFELGLEITDLSRYALVDSLKGGTDTACIKPLETALSKRPDALLVAIGPLKDNACVVREVHKLKEAGRPVPRLLFADAGQRPELAELLKPEAFELMEGLSLAWGIDSNFAQAFEDRTGEKPGQYAANTYDAVLLLAYGLASSKGRLGAELEAGMKAAVDGRGERVGWDEKGVARALEAIANGKTPDITGATGPLNYDSEYYSDLVSSTYSHWAVEQGTFVIEEFISTSDEAQGTELVAAFRDLASTDRLSEPQAFVTQDPSVSQVDEHKASKAVIVAASAGWENYRHQSDALALYARLKSAGMNDDDILFIAADDIADHPNNIETKTIYNEMGGENLYGEIKVDYRLADVSPNRFLSLLKGRANEGSMERAQESHSPLKTGKSDNLYIFLVGHGGKKGLAWQAESVEEGLEGGAGIEFLKPQELAMTLQEMSEATLFRRAILVVEACHGGVFGRAVSELKVPRVLALTGASAEESSRARNYHRELGVWLANEFAFAVHESLSDTDVVKLPLADLYRRLYERVPGSHVQLFNARYFGDVAQITMREFLSAPD